MKNRFKRNSFLPRSGVVVFILPAFFLIWASFSFGSCKNKTKGATGPNLLLVTIEGMRGDLSGPRVAKPMEMPVLDRLWKQGTVLTRVIMTSPKRAPSISSIFTGLYPMGHGVRNDRAERLPQDVTTLAELLLEEGWRTGAVVSNVDTIAASGLAQGFEYYDDGLVAYPLDIGLPHRGWAPPAKADDVTARAISWIRQPAKVKKPWFLWVEYSDALLPRSPPPPFLDLFPGDRYSAGLAFVDANLGILLGKMRDLGLMKDTLVVITSSHGLPLGERGESAGTVFTYLSSISVSSVFVLPGKIPTNREEHEIVSSVDLMPTVLRIMGISKPKEKIDGTDISQAILNAGSVKAKTVYSENLYLNLWYGWKPVRSIISGNLHFLDLNPSELYDIASDPKEEKNIAGQDKAKTEKLANEMKKLLANSKSRESAEAEAVLTEVETKLKRLGYLSDSPGGDMGELSKEEITALYAQMRSAAMERKNRNSVAAKKKYRKIIGKYPDFSFALYTLATLLADSSSSQEEVGKLLERVLVGGSRYMKAAAMTRLAMMLITGKQMVEAENLLNLASKLAPDNPAIYNELGNVYLTQKLNSEAEKVLRKCIQIEPRFFRAHFGLALLYVNDTQRIPAAVSELSKVLEYNSNFAPAHLMLAKIAATYFGNKKEAKKHLDKVLEISPGGRIADEARNLLEKLQTP